MPSLSRATCLLPWIALFLTSAVASKDGELTVERIYSGSEFRSKSVSMRWLDDSTYAKIESAKGPSGGSDLVAYDVESGSRSVLVSAEHLVPSLGAKPLEIEDFTLSNDRSLVLIYTNSKRVWRRNTRGDYWILDRSSRELRRLGGDAPASTLMFAKLSPTAPVAAYVHDRDIWIEDLRDGSVRRLTQRKSDAVINGTFDWVYEEEFGLRDGFRFSPDGETIAYWQIDTTGVRKFPLVNNTDGLYPKIQWIEYPKVGETNSICRVGAIPVAGGKTTWARVEGDPCNNYIARLHWVDAKTYSLQYLNRLQNHNRILFVEAASGRPRQVFEDRDEAWVRVLDEIDWFDGGAQFSFASERDGWRHSYLVDSSNGTARCMTKGSYDVQRLLRVDVERGWAYFEASPDNATQRYLYRSRVDGSGEAERLTPEDQCGTHRYTLSPGGSYALHSYSSFDVPPVIELVRLPSHETVRVLEDNSELRKRLAKLTPQKSKFFRVDIGDGVELDGWGIFPPGLDPDAPKGSKSWPLFVYVYGEPAGQTVLDRWGGSRYLWHRMLAQRGYVVMSFDNRGTPAPRGREWRKCVYRQVGILAPKEQAAAVRSVLASRSYLDPKRVGVWGWSGGGSMSLNAIFRYPDLYHTAMVIAPVPNQRLYDTIYQERYMGLPSTNVEGFQQGSPVTHAHRLKGNLLLIHGTGDDNCHYQGMEVLINELVRHNKPFSMMAYPNRSHSIREGVHTTVHLRNLLQRYLENHLKRGPIERR